VSQAESQRQNSKGHQVADSRELPFAAPPLYRRRAGDRKSVFARIHCGRELPNTEEDVERHVWPLVEEQVHRMPGEYTKRRVWQYE